MEKLMVFIAMYVTPVVGKLWEMIPWRQHHVRFVETLWYLWDSLKVTCDRITLFLLSWIKRRQRQDLKSICQESVFYQRYLKVRIT